MIHLIDTSIVMRSEDLDSPLHDLCKEALKSSRASGDGRICAQVVIEFWAAATRPKDVNGPGMTPLQVDIAVAGLTGAFAVLPEPPNMLERWRYVGSANGVSGKQAHDARLAALMGADGIAHVLTQNTADFRRYPGITPAHPQDGGDLIGG